MSPAGYRESAEEAERLARLAGSPEERQAYLEIARTWRDLAARADADARPDRAD